VKIGQVDPEIICLKGFISLKMRGVHADDPLKLRSYWTEVHQTYTQYSKIIITDELKSEWRFRMPGRRITLGERPISPILMLKLVAMATFLERSERSHGSTCTQS